MINMSVKNMVQWRTNETIIRARTRDANVVAKDEAGKSGHEAGDHDGKGHTATVVAHRSALRCNEPSFLHSCAVLSIDRRQASELVAVGFAAGLEALGISGEGAGVTVYISVRSVYCRLGSVFFFTEAGGETRLLIIGRVDLYYDIPENQTLLNNIYYSSHLSPPFQPSHLGAPKLTPTRAPPRPT
jgi:hypothetical protein